MFGSPPSIDSSIVRDVAARGVLIQSERGVLIKSECPVLIAPDWGVLEKSDYPVLITPEYSRTAIIYNNPFQFSEKRKNYRAVWKEKRNENPNSSPAELNKKAPNVYIWLNRHDKEWLKKNTPALRIRNPNRSFADWNALDKIILKSYQTAFYDLIRSDQRPVRISKEQLSLAAGYKSYVSSGEKLNRMPLTAAFLMENIESRDAYRKRKIVWAACELEKDNVSIAKYKLMRKAIIPDRMTKEYWVYYENEIKKQGLQPIE